MIIQFGTRAKAVALSMCLPVILAAPMALTESGRAFGQDETPLVGMLLAINEDGGKRLVDAFLAGMSGLGYVDGENVRYEARYLNGDFAQIGPLLTELEGLDPDVILSAGVRTLLDPKTATLTVPTVIAHAPAPAFLRIVGDLEHPQGQITGILQVPYGPAQEFDLILELVPDAKRVGYVLGSDLATADADRQAVEQAAMDHGVEAEVDGAASPDEAMAAFSRIVAKDVDAAVLAGSAVFVVAMPELAPAAREAGLPLLSTAFTTADLGGLASQGVDIVGFWGAAAPLVDQLLQGATPSDIAIVESVPLLLRINATAAEELGLTVPDSVLSRAEIVN